VDSSVAIALAGLKRSFFFLLMMASATPSYNRCLQEQCQLLSDQTTHSSVWNSWSDHIAG